MGGRRCIKYRQVYSPSTGGYVRRCADFSGDFAGLSGFGQITSLKTAISNVKDVLIFGGIAGGGAIVTEKVFDTISKSIPLEGYWKEAAKMGTGVLLGILVGKVTKKPQIAVAFAIGPVVAGVINIIHALMGEVPVGWEATTEGMGMVAIDPYRDYAYSGAEAPDVGAIQVGKGIPPWIYGGQQTPAGAYPFASQV